MKFEPKVGLNILLMFKVYRFNCSFLLTLALKTKTCVMALFVPTWSKLNPSLIEIPRPCRLMMGF
jgi:hypothetical protein